MRKLIGALGLAATVLLAACGGGGGSAGDTQEQYSITLRADRTSLPVNLAGERPGLNGYSGIGAYSPYTTTLYVSAREGNDAIQGSGDTEVFGCNVAGGLDVGSLYYLDGKEEHEVEVMVNGTQVKIPGSYRSISLPSNSGGASFHLHAGNQAGVVRITCSITDPRDSRVYSASVDITVGGGSGTGRPSRVDWLATTPNFKGFMGSRDNTNNLPNTVALQALVWDDANQRIPNPPAANLQISINKALSSGYVDGQGMTADGTAGARLLAGSQSGSVIQVATSNGVANFSVRSGPNRGYIVLELVTDRFDNNVTNGIQDPITRLVVVPVAHAVGTEALASDVAASITADNGVPFAYLLQAHGGVPPYTWTLVGGKLPAGLTLNPSGLITGTPNAPADTTYPLTFALTDQHGTTGNHLTVSTTLQVKGDPATVAALNANCGGSGSVCQLPDATDGESYAYVFSAMSADPDKPITWSFSGLPSHGLSASGTTGTISGTAQMTPACPTTSQVVTFTVTATQGTMSTTRRRWGRPSSQAA